MAKQDHTLNLALFPPLRWNKYFWTGETVLRSWAGFQKRHGPYASANSKAKSDGSARLSINIATEDDAPKPPVKEQEKAYAYLMENEEEIAKAVLQAIFDEYPSMRMCTIFAGSELYERAPEIGQPKQLQRLIGLNSVHILNVIDKAVAYVGFEFGCTWDEEHGLGVMTHRKRIVTAGHADCSFLA